LRKIDEGFFFIVTKLSYSFLALMKKRHELSRNFVRITFFLSSWTNQYKFTLRNQFYLEMGPDPIWAYFWPAVNKRLARLSSRYFLFRPEAIFFFNIRREKLKNLTFLGEIFKTQTQTINGWPDLSYKNFLTQTHHYWIPIYVTHKHQVSYRMSIGSLMCSIFQGRCCYLVEMSGIPFRHMPFCHMPICHNRLAIVDSPYEPVCHTPIRHTVCARVHAHSSSC